MSYIFQKAIRFSDSSNKLVSVTKVKVSSDLTIAKVYVSIYPSKNKDNWIRGLRENASQVKHVLSQKLKNELRVIPKLAFFLDDSLDYIEKIESSLRDGENPIKE
jgi:ribosome-binding factor A